MLTNNKSEAYLDQAIVRDKLRFWQAKSRQIARDVSIFNANPDQTPIFFFHGDWETGGFFTHKIARELGKNQPFVALAPQGMNADPVPPSIEQMAAFRLPLLRKMNPEGPFRLGGYCNGALIAYEIARQLAAEGRQIDYVAMIDPPTVNARPTMRWIHRSLSAVMGLMGGPPAVQRAHLGNAMNIVWAAFQVFGSWVPSLLVASWQQKRSLLGAQIRKASFLISRLKRTPPADPSDDQAGSNVERVEKIYHRALARYLPEPSDIRVLLLNSGINEYSYPDCHYSVAPWRNISAAVDVRPLSGTHLSCVHDDAAMIAAYLRSWSPGRLVPLPPDVFACAAALSRAVAKPSS